MMLDVRIESLVFGGRGVGRVDGKAVFVPATAPGDIVRCRVVRDKKRYAEADLVEILTQSPLRRNPPCPVAGECGGCQWQHLPYDCQRQWKETIFRETLVRQAGIEGDRVIVAAPDEWGYRSRVQFKCRMTEKGFVIGFYRPSSHYVVDVDRCPITDNRLNDLLPDIRRVVGESPFAAQVPQADLGIGHDGLRRILFHFIGSDIHGFMRWLNEPANIFDASLFVQCGRKETLLQVYGEMDLRIQVGEPALTLGYGPGGFAQVNLVQNTRLVADLLAAARLTGKERVLDLFCGMGNFSLPLARVAAKVVGVEDFAPSIEKAQENARKNNIHNVVFYARPAAGAAIALSGSDGFDLVVLDPPRTGAYEVVKELVTLDIQRILYVSCDPPSLARDLQPLIHHGYTLEWSRPVDLFPQTFHTESLTLLARK